MTLLGAGPTGAAASHVGGVEDIGRQMAQVRGLAAVGEMAIEEVDEATLRANLARELGEVGASEQPVLVLLGLLTPEFEARTFALDVLTEGQAALYSRRDKRLYLGPSAVSLTGAAKLALAHEVAHAIQDQHFELDQLLDDSAEAGDRHAAVSALIEGDAMLTMVRWGRAFLTPGEKASLATPDRPGAVTRLAEAPLVVREELLFPHREGHSFVQALYDRGGHDAINQAFAAPPITTEQVIHPDKYVLGELPRPVTLPPLAGALGENWQTLGSGALGELRVRILIEQFADRREAEAAAAGWHGDRYTLLADEAGRRILVWSTAWDSEGDAIEFYNAYGRSVARRFGTEARRTIDIPSLNRWTTPLGQFQLLKTGDQVLLIVAPNGDLVEAVAGRFR